MLKVSKHSTTEDDAEEKLNEKKSAYLWFHQAEYTGVLLDQQT